MKCATAPECDWLSRFGCGACQRRFRAGTCRPIDEGSEDIEEMPVQSDRNVQDEEPE